MEVANFSETPHYIHPKMQYKAQKITIWTTLLSVKTWKVT